MMQFEAVVEDGVIKVPEEYPGSASGVVTVFDGGIDNPDDISLDAQFAAISERRRIRPCSAYDFRSFKIDRNGWKFDREEANAR